MTTPNPADRLAAFRLGRLGQGVDAISTRAQDFRAEVETTLAGDRSPAASNKAMAGAFVAAYRALSEALEAAKSGNVVRGPALDALAGIMGNLKTQYAAGVSDLRASVDQLSESAPAFDDFCEAARDKIDRLEMFWKETFKPLAPQWKPKA
ncbi:MULTISPECIES: hypothetical protein [Burkholderiaceae]|uniref:hypothetical protein n=1 Tax=Burkholderiaceae TaxID=119060 RepID=UPI0015FD8DAD|nr:MULTISPECIES: hypothetical protein [Burkholderiaceae]MBA9902261.1 hypothetical protein [Burkholderia cepacia]MBA9949173.1 hypothetical protein [Burkholderia cepacia]MBA9979465.1 hypothetical protein [Burkholderia cepacia]MBA9998304.1 hypothetical protein [Burkholderia cepacia]MBB0006236.1 hypothetical protein [Burkholderia cepacia]